MRHILARERLSDDLVRQALEKAQSDMFQVAGQLEQKDNKPEDDVQEIEAEVE